MLAQGNQRQPVAISGNQWQSVPEIIPAGNVQSVAISGNQWQSVPEIIPAGMVRHVELQLVQSELSALASAEWASAVLGLARALWRERRVDLERRVEREPLEASADEALRPSAAEPPPPLHVSGNQRQSVPISCNQLQSVPTLHVSDKAARAAIYALLKRPPLCEVLTTQSDAETLAIRICG